MGGTTRSGAGTMRSVHFSPHVSRPASPPAPSIYTAFDDDDLEHDHSHSDDATDATDETALLPTSRVRLCAPRKRADGKYVDDDERWWRCWRWWGRRGWSWASVVALVLLAAVLGVIFWENEEDDETGLLVSARHGVVASDVEECSKIGVAVMERGGNAVDAVIATGICIGSVNMFASGIGGGGFMVVRTANGTAASFNFRETAPAGAHRHMFDADPRRAQVGGLAVGVPGEVHGYATAHRAFGAAPWADLWAPSIALSRHGFRVSPVLARTVRASAAAFRRNRAAWRFLFDASGRLLAAGDTLRRPEYARTLATIAGVGPGAPPDEPYAGVAEFYNGTIAARLAATIQSAGGIVTPADFAAYTTVTTPTLATTFAGRTVLTCPPPCAGAVLLEGLNIASLLPLDDPAAPTTPHYLVEAMKWLSAGRTELGDPFDPLVRANAARIAELQTHAFAAAVRANVSADTTFGWRHYNPAYEPNDPKGTSHISALDAHGNAAALTTTVNLYWGAMVHDPDTGVVLNSQMDDFSIPGRSNAFLLRPSVYNYILPGKRPLSSTAPTIVVSGGGAGGDGAGEGVDLVLGGSGGSRIVTGVFEAVVKKCLWGYDLLETIRSPRMHHQLIPETVYAEAAVADETVAELEIRGHAVERRGRNEKVGLSVLQAVARRADGEGVEGVADWWRMGGKAAGY